MDIKKQGVREITKDAYEKHMLVRVYSNPSTLVPPLFSTGVDLRAGRLLNRAVLVKVGPAYTTRNRNYGH
jgi:hypothetical protein